MHGLENELSQLSAKAEEHRREFLSLGQTALSLLDERGVGDAVRLAVAAELGEKTQAVALLPAAPTEETPEASPLRRPRSKASAKSNPRADGKTCTRNGCDAPLFCKGLCRPHYDSARHTATPSKRIASPRARRQKYTEEFQREVLADVLKTKPGTQERTRAMILAIRKEHDLPDGTRGTVPKSQLYLWAKQLSQ